MKNFFKKSLGFIGGASFFFVIGIFTQVTIGWFIYTNNHMLLSQKALITFLITFFEGSMSIVIYDFFKRDLFFIEKYKKEKILENKSKVFKIVDYLLNLNTQSKIVFGSIIIIIIWIAGPFVSSLIFRKDLPYSFHGIIAGSGLKYMFGTSLLVIPFKLIYIDSFTEIFLIFQKWIS